MQSVSVPVVGDGVVETDETFVLTLSSNPTAATISRAQGTGTITNDDVPALSIADVSVPEGNAGAANVSFGVTLSQPSFKTVTVSYATANGTATAGSDYSPLSGTLTFAPGVTAATVVVSELGDRVFESDETFVVNPSGPHQRHAGQGARDGDDHQRRPCRALHRRRGGEGTRSRAPRRPSSR